MLWSELAQKPTVKWDSRTYLSVVGRLPVDDDLDRVNCDEAGEFGHISCGVCKKHNLPFYECDDCLIQVSRFR